jgi:hypothetical protein
MTGKYFDVFSFSGHFYHQNASTKFVKLHTFGHGDSPSSIIFGLNADEDQPLIAETTKISVREKEQFGT